MRVSFAPIIAALLCVASVVAEKVGETKKKATDSNVQYIKIGPDAFTGLFIGFFLFGMLLFVIRMLASIQTSDTIGQPDKKTE